MKPKMHENIQPLFHYFRIENLVPEDHILRSIDKAVDFSFVRDLVKDCYCPDNGRPGVDPELVVRMLLIGYFYNLSEKRLCEEVKMHAAYRWFCHLSFDDPVPDRSTLNRLRNHRWASVGLFEKIMHHVVQQCIDAGLVSGKHLGVDGTQIRANAPIKSLEPIEVSLPLNKYLQEMNFKSKDKKGDNNNQHPQDKDFHGERFTNQTHRSKTDPDARLYRKSRGKEASLSYIGHNLIDTKSRVILATKATMASRSSEPKAALDMLEELERFSALNHKKKTLTADTGYGSAEFIADVLDKDIIPHIPLLAGSQPEPIPTWKNRSYKPHLLAKRKQKVRLAKARNKARAICLTSDYKLSQKLRKRLEHIFAEAKICHGMRRARCHGLPSVQDQLYMTATVQNLKRLVSANKRKMKLAINSSVYSKIVYLTRRSLLVNVVFEPFINLINPFENNLASLVVIHVK